MPTATNHALAALTFVFACTAPAPPPVNATVHAVPPPRPSPPPAAPPRALTASTVVPAAALAQDLAILRSALESLHPGLLRYNTEASLAAHFDALTRELSRDRTLAETFLALTRFTAALRCGHTYPSFFNQSKAVSDALFEGPRLPLLFRWLEGKMVVTRSLRDDARIPPGSVIEAVNGHAAAEIRDALLTLVRADGGNDDKRQSLLGVDGGSTYEEFDVYWPLLFPWTSREVALDVRRPDGTTERVSTPLMDAAERAAAVASLAPSTADGPLWKLAWHDAQTAYMRMPTWVAYKTAWPWERELHAAMAEVATRPARRLIVDLRGNEGGSDVGDVIVAHLIARPLHALRYERRVRYARVPDALRAHLDTWDASFFDWGSDAVPLADGWFRLRASEDAAERVIAPAAPRFRGAVFVLVDAENSSATFQFADLVQREQLATLIGEPTGGSLRGINGGAFFFLRLPGSGLEVDVPLIGTFPVDASGHTVDVPDRGVIPDVRVPTTAAEVATGRDAQLDAARRAPSR